MYARSIVLAVSLVISIGLESGVYSFDDDHLVKKDTSLREDKEKTRRDERLYGDIQGKSDMYKKYFKKTFIWNGHGSFKRNVGMLNTQRALKENVPKRDLRFHHHHHHHHHHYHHHHNKTDNNAGQLQRIPLFDPVYSSKQGEVMKFLDSGNIVKKSLVKPAGRKQYRQKLARIAAERKRKNETKGNYGKNVQGVLPRHKTDKRFMVNSVPRRNTLPKRKPFQFSHVLVNAIKLVLDQKNSFKKDANILNLAKALQSRDSESDIGRNNSITTAVSHGLTQNGQRVRLVTVKDPGYMENMNHRDGLRIPQPAAYRSKISQDSKHPQSALVNPTELGISILKLLFGKKARLITKPKYRTLVGSRPDMKYLEGYGSLKQRAELERQIEQENRMILLRGVKKHRLEKTLAKSISDLINALNKNKDKVKKGVSREHKHNDEVNVGSKEGNVGRKQSSAEDQVGTRKSWVLLKLPKKNEEIVGEKVHHYQEPEKENDKSSKASINQVATQGKQNNELSDVKVIHHHKPHILSSYDDVTSVSEAGLRKKPSVVTKDSSTDTESRTVPQISYNLSGIKSHKDVQHLSGVDPSALALTLGKILKGIQESVKELRNQRKPKEGSLESSSVAKLTSPVSHTSTTSSDTSFSQAKSDAAVAKIPDLLSAVNKLLGKGSSSLQSPSSTDMPGIPSDQGSVQTTTINVPTVDNGDTAAARRYMDEIRASTNPLQLRPSLGLYDEPITSAVVGSKKDNQESLDNVLFESDELGTQRDTQATMDAIKLKEDLESFAEKGLNAHNKYRVLHHSQNLKWSDDLATQAEKMAYDMAMKGTIEKSTVASALGYGENVAKITGTTFNKAGEEATNLWYAEVANYSYSDPRLSPRTDSFTQVVWKGTTKLGMGCARDLQTNDLYVVALYDPKGNDPVGLRSNVLNKGGVTQDVYASIFKRRTLKRKLTSTKINDK